jgi:asparagine synthase (glutamine-hydrolysing)
LSASVSPRGYPAELFLRLRWKKLIDELRALEPRRSLNWPTIRRELIRPMMPQALLRWTGRHKRFGHLVPYPIREDFIRDVLGKEIHDILEAIYGLAVEFPDHRKNLAHAISMERLDARQRSHAGFVDHEDTVTTYPFLDKRMLEFCLAVDGHFKTRKGRNRLLIRDAMDGLLPSPIVRRTSKIPFAPDYHQRFDAERSHARSIFDSFTDSARVSGIVDFQEAKRALDNPVEYDPEYPMSPNYDAQFTVPWGIYLCYFLDRFGG